MDHSNRYARRPARLAALAFLTIFVLAGLLRGSAAQPALAAGVPVRYDGATIFIGEDYSNPAYAKDPANAPKTAITIPEVAAALNNPALLQNQGGGAWLLKTNVVISGTARLEVTGPTVTWLRIDSSPAGRPFPAYTSIAAKAGALLVQDAKVTSWAGSAVDTNYYDGRSYLVALSGGRMDLIRSEIAYLGWSAGEPSGLAWRLRAGYGGDDPVTPDNIKFGATGSIQNSNIHDNYFGQYSFEAYNLKVLHNEFHHNVVYGFDPHDYSTGFEVAYNSVHDNGKHGIIFSRGCTGNNIHNNVVYNNADHGIMLDRGSNVNQISDNEVYYNSDGVAIFESEKNLIQNNNLHDNERGVRINATFDSTDRFDSTANENVVLNNTIRDNLQYGVYLYERADKNTIVGNTVSGNAGAGLYIKTGANTIKNNSITGNGDGISIVGADPYTPGIVPPSDSPGHKNVIQGNTIENNDDNGIQGQTAVDNQIGLNEVGVPNAALANQIRTNGNNGISLDAASTKNLMYGNTITANGGDGVTIKGPASPPAIDSRNKVTRNSISANADRGISVDATANKGIQPPTITSAPNANPVTGTAAPSAKVEVYRDPDGEGKVYKGTATANASGAWSFTLPSGDNPQDGAINALQIDASGNTSQFAVSSSGGGSSYEIGVGKNGDLTIFVNGPGSHVTLTSIQQAIQVISPTVPLLQNQGGGTWQSNASLFFNRGVTLTLASAEVSWLKLRSQTGNISLSSGGGGNYNYKSFVTLRTYGGAILINGVKITSWDPAANTYDMNVSDGRSYLLAKYDARMDISNSDLSYLGSADGESYGVAWRDINDSAAPGTLRTRVTGNVLNSNFSHNYYGIYTFQATTMVFRNNHFHDNIGYGFDPHDFSHDFVIEDNESNNNGNHGFIISRGCNNFVFRRNKSHDNHYTIGTDVRHAQGFMLDPGSPNSRFPQQPSHDNLFEYNQAWGNDGYGLRIVGSINNTIRNNTFTGNLQGVTFEQSSTGNTLQNNTITGSQLYGVYLIGGSDNNTISGNTVTHSGKHGIYIKTGHNTISGNIVTDNGAIVAGETSGSGIATLQESDTGAAAADLVLPNGVSLAADSELLDAPELATIVTGNQITGNQVLRNVDEGIELKGSMSANVASNVIQSNGSNGVYLASGTQGTTIAQNAITLNHAHGIQASGADVASNHWTNNAIYSNGSGGIVTTNNANGSIKAPSVLRTGNTVTITTLPNAWVDLYSDAGGQGRYFEVRLQANSSGSLIVTRTWQSQMVNATATDSGGNSSSFTYNLGAHQVYLPLINRK